MKTITITAFERDAEDYRGKQHSIVYYVDMDGDEKALSKQTLLQQIELNLEERGAGPVPEKPTPLLDQAAGDYAAAYGNGK